MALAAINPAVLQQFHSPNRASVNRKWHGILWRRVIINFLKDLSEKKFCFSRTRGVLYAFSQLHQIYKLAPDDLLQWYPEFQTRLLTADRYTDIDKSQ